jgi:hypothetical protein
MKNTISNAAAITVLAPIADATIKTGGGPVSIGATVIVASKGPVNKVVKVYNKTWQDVFGKPLPKRVDGMEGLRHVADAAKECDYINVVRAIHSDARFPSLLINQINFRGAWAPTTAYALDDVVISNSVKFICTTAHTSSDTAPTNEAHTNWGLFAGTIEVGKASGENGHPYGASLSLGAGYVCQIYPIDGDPSVNRSLEIKNVVTEKGAWVTGTTYEENDIITVTGGRLICINAHTAGATAPTKAAPTTAWKVYHGQYDKRFTLNFYDKDEDGTEYLLESYLVGILETDKDDMGRSAYIETVLERDSDIFRAIVADDLTWTTIQPSLKYAVKTTFTGGSNGTTPDAADFISAWDLFRNEIYACDLMFAAGNYDPEVLANCIDVATERHVSFFFDVSPALDSDSAMEWLRGTGLEGRQANVYYLPFSARDVYYGGKTVWGGSGDAVAACAKGNANYSGATPGIHYAPAGPNRGRLTRTEIAPLHPSDIIDRDAFYSARINPIIAGDNGGTVIDDALSLYYKEDYLRFTWVNRILNYIDQNFYFGAKSIKFEPDGLTKAGLTRIMKDLLDSLVTSGALVAPRDPEKDGKEPYILTVEQLEIDLWQVTWDVCPTGAARRIAGQPRLIK